MIEVLSFFKLTSGSGFLLLGKAVVGKNTFFIYRGKGTFLTGDYCSKSGDAYMYNGNLDRFSVMIWRKFEHEVPLPFSYRKSVYYVQ